MRLVMEADVAISQKPRQAAVGQVQLSPKEHGAYAILAIPLLTGLIAAGPTTVGLAVVVAATFGFLAHEPLLVALGYRGTRAQRSAPAATWRLAGYLIVLVASGCVALIFGSSVVRWALVGCAVGATASFIVALLGKHRTLMGQLLGVVGLSAPCVPVFLAGPVALETALESWATLLLGFVSTTIAVRGVIAAQKRQSRVLHFVILVFMSAIVVGSITTGHSLACAVVPMVGMAWCLLLSPPPARYLKRVGWTLVTGTIASAIWLLQVL